MDHFEYRGDTLWAEEVPLPRIAQQVGTPVYVYSRATLERHWQAFDRALAGHPHLVCYAVKANSNLAVLNVLARLGSGFDIVSAGELARVIRAGGDPGRVVFSGVGKTAPEMVEALQAGIRCFNVESEAELRLLAQVARDQHVCAPVSLRVNPDVDPQTHPYISTGLKENKFGIAVDEAWPLYQWAAEHEHLQTAGIDCHIGSQLTRLEPFLDALRRVLTLVDRLAEHGIALRHIDVGGGLGIRYREESPPPPDAYAQALRRLLKDRGQELLVEPGRAIAGNAGVLLTRVQYLKPTVSHHFVIVDAAMNDLLRPALYDAWQEIVAVRRNHADQGPPCDVVGPVCETGDFLGKQRALNVGVGDLLAVRSAGAYGFSMSSNYNSRPRPAEVMVDGDRFQVVRARESIDDLFAGETLLPNDSGAARQA